MSAASSGLRSWRRWSLAGAALSLVAGLTVPVPVAAEQGMGPGPRRLGRMGPGGPAAMGLALGQLNLTQEQRQQVRDVMQRHREGFKAIGTQMRTARQALRQASTADVVDEAALRAATTQVAEAQAQGAILRGKIRQEILALLTPEQREQAKALRARFEQRMELRRQRMQQRLSQRPMVQPQ